MINPFHDTNRSARNEREAIELMNAGVESTLEQHQEYERKLRAMESSPSDLSHSLANFVIAVIFVGVVVALALWGRFQY